MLCYVVKHLMYVICNRARGSLIIRPSRQRIKSERMSCYTCVYMLVCMHACAMYEPMYICMRACAYFLA